MGTRGKLDCNSAEAIEALAIQEGVTPIEMASMLRVKTRYRPSKFQEMVENISDGRDYVHENPSDGIPEHAGGNDITDHIEAFEALFNEVSSFEQLHKAAETLENFCHISNEDRGILRDLLIVTWDKLTKSKYFAATTRFALDEIIKYGSPCVYTDEALKEYQRKYGDNGIMIVRYKDADVIYIGGSDKAWKVFVETFSIQQAVRVE